MIMDPNDVKKFAGKHVNGVTKDGAFFQGKVMYFCNEYCDKWTLNLEDSTEVELDEISTISSE